MVVEKEEEDYCLCLSTNIYTLIMGLNVICDMLTYTTFHPSIHPSLRPQEIKAGQLLIIHSGRGQVPFISPPGESRPSSTRCLITHTDVAPALMDSCSWSQLHHT